MVFDEAVGVFGSRSMLYSSRDSGMKRLAVFPLLCLHCWVTIGFVRCDLVRGGVCHTRSIKIFWACGYQLLSRLHDCHLSLGVWWGCGFLYVLGCRFTGGAFVPLDRCAFSSSPLFQDGIGMTM